MTVSKMAAKPESTEELVKEHRRLVAVLRSPSHADDEAEADRQEDELEEYEGEMKKAIVQSHTLTHGGRVVFVNSYRNRRGEKHEPVKHETAKPEPLNWQAMVEAATTSDKPIALDTETAWIWIVPKKFATEPLQKAVTRGSADTAINYRLQMIAAQIGPLAVRAQSDAEAKRELEDLLTERYTLMVAAGQASI